MATDPERQDLQSLVQAAAHPANAVESEDESEHEDGDNPEKRKKRARACQACRKMKIKCIPVDGQDACQACAKVNRQCVLPGPAKKRLKTVHKVAELEKKIEALTYSLIAKQQGQPTPPQDSPPVTLASRNSISNPVPQQSDISTRSDSFQNPTPATFPAAMIPISRPEREPEVTDYIDVIDRGLMTISTAKQIFDSFWADMNFLLPLVALNPNDTIDNYRKTRPFLLLTILASACGPFAPELQVELHEELARQLSERVFFRFERSLDLIQSMIIVPTWLGRHRNSKDLGFNQYIHSSVVMALDLGLGKRSKKPLGTNAAEECEMRRTYLSCYYSSAVVGTTLRVPTMIRNSPYVQDCVDYLENSPASQPSDRSLCALVKIIMLMEEVAITFHMDDPVSNVYLNDTAVQYQLRSFEKRLAEWKLAAGSSLKPQQLEFLEAISNVFIHEISLHEDHNVDDFKPPMNETMTEQHPSKDFITPSHLGALSTCVKSMNKALTIFLEVYPRTFKILPCMFYVWTAYCVIAMIRLNGALRLSNSKYCDVFLPDLQVDYYVDRIAAAFRQSPPYYTTGHTFEVAFHKLKVWHNHRFSDKPGVDYSGTDELRRGLWTVHKEMEKMVDDEGDAGNSSAQASQKLSDFQIPDVPIDASAFENQDWNFSLEDWNDFEQSMVQPAGGGWLGYLI